MKKFQFPLQKVLEYDTHMQKNEADALSVLQAEYARLERKRDDMQADYDVAKRRYQADCEQGQSASRAVVTGLFITDQRQQIAKINDQIKEQMRRIEKQRERLVAITKDKTMIEKLKEQARLKYLAAQRKSDEQFIAEIVTNQTAQAGT